MADFEITDPAGKKFVVTAPEGATQEQVLAYAQSQFKAPAAPQQSSYGDRLGQGALALGKGLIAGGPLGLAVAGVGEGMRQGTELLNKAAYNTGGAVTDLAAPHMSPETAAKLGFGANVGIQAIPTLLGAALGKTAEPQVKSAAESVMQSALKPPLKALQQGKGEAAVKTLLNEGINVTPGGVEKLQGKVDVLNNAVSLALKNSPATVDKGQVASRIQDVINRIEKTSLNPQDRVMEVQKVYDQVLANNILPPNIPVGQAQRIKVAIYQTLREKYGQLGSDTVEAQKALARGLKEEIAAAVPEVAKLNAKESELLNALVLAQRRALMSGNKNPAGLGLLAKSPGYAASFLADRSELFKSIVARLINANAGTIPVAAGATVGGAAGVYSGQPPQ